MGSYQSYDIKNDTQFIMKLHKNDKESVWNELKNDKKNWSRENNGNDSLTIHN